MRFIAGVIGCALLIYVVAFWRLGDASFWDPDEAHYAETTRELIANGGWLAPTYNGEPFFDKPILFHWLQSIPMRFVQSPEAAARVVPAAAAVALAGVTYWLGLEVAGSAVGLMGALLLVSSPAVFALARYAILDTVLTALLFGGVALVAISALRGGSRLQYLGYALLGLATFVKGPLTLALCGLAFGIALLSSRDARRHLLALHWVRGLVIVVGIATPWFALMLREYGLQFAEGFFLKENVRLFAQPLYGNQPRWWFYPVIIATGLLPWTGIVVGRAFDQVHDRLKGRSSLDVFDVLLWSWVAAVVSFFSLSSFKLDHYVFPAAPAFCLIAARGWNAVRLGPQEENAATRFGVRIVGPVLAIAGIASSFLAVDVFGLPTMFLTAPVLLLVMGTAATVRYRGRARGLPRVPTLAVAALGVIYAAVLIWVVPHLERVKVVPDVARWVSGHAADGDRIATYRLDRWNPAYRFYVNRRVEMLESEEEARTFFADQRPYFCVMTSQMYDTLRHAGVSLRVVHSQKGMWVTSGRMLWRRPGELTHFVVVAPDI